MVDNFIHENSKSESLGEDTFRTWSIILNSTPRRLHVIKRVPGHGLQQPERAREKGEHVFYSVHQQNPWANCQKTNDKHPHYLMFWDVDREWFIHFVLLLGVETGSGRNQGGSELFGLCFFSKSFIPNCESCTFY